MEIQRISPPAPQPGGGPWIAAVLVLGLSVGLAAEQPAARPMLLYMGPSYHEVSTSEFSDYLAAKGVVLEGQSSNGGMFGIMYPAAKDASTYYSGDLSIYQVKSEPVNYSHRILLLEIGGHVEPLDLIKGFTICWGAGPAFINEKRRFGILEVSDSILGWPWFLGARYRRSWMFFDLRYRPVNLVYTTQPKNLEMNLKLGGLFLVIGGQFSVGR